MIGLTTIFLLANIKIVNVKETFVMKKRALILTVLLLCVFGLSACNPSMDKIKQKYRNEGYTVQTVSADGISKIAGCVECFNVSKGEAYKTPYVSGSIYKFSKKDLAEESKNNASGPVKITKKGVYLLLAYGYSIDEKGSWDFMTESDPEMQALINIFNSFF